MIARFPANGLNQPHFLSFLVCVCQSVGLLVQGHAVGQQQGPDTQPRVYENYQPGQQLPVDVVVSWGQAVQTLEPQASTHWADQAQAQLLCFVLRSVEQYMPFAHHLYLLTPGLVPTWWNSNNPRATHQVVPPGQQLLDQLQTVPNLTKLVLALGASTFLVQPLAQYDLVHQDSGLLRLNLGAPVGPNCETWQGHQQDETCAYLNSQYNSYSKVPWYQVPHHLPLVLHQDMLQYLPITQEQVAQATPQKSLDLVFLALNAALAEGLGTASSPLKGAVATWGDKPQANRKTWCALMANKRAMAKSVEVEVLNPQSGQQPLTVLVQQLCTLFPRKSSFEAPDLPNVCDTFTEQIPQYPFVCQMLGVMGCRLLNTTALDICIWLLVAGVLAYLRVWKYLPTLFASFTLKPVPEKQI